MDPIIVSLDERLASSGDTLVLTEHVDISGYEMGDRYFALEKGLDADVVLTNAGEGILVNGIIRGAVTAQCDRCLDEAHFDLSAEIDEYYLFKAPLEEELADDEESSDFLLVSPDKTLDLSLAFMPAVYMDTPFVVLCKEDCLGLCPVCGENLNKHDCGHASALAEQKLAERMQQSPFAALKDLDLGQTNE